MNAGHMPSRTAHEAAQLLADQGKHSHLHADHETTCISGNCIPVPTVLAGLHPQPAATRRYL